MTDSSVSSGPAAPPAPSSLDDAVATWLLPLPVPGSARVLVADETRYASGSHKEYAARAAVTAAVAAGFSRVVLATCGNLGRAIAAAAAAHDLTATVVMPEGWSDGGVSMRALGAEVVLVPGVYEDAVAVSRQLAAEPGAVDANPHGPLAEHMIAGHGLVVDAMAAVLPEPPAGIWVPVGNGTTAIGVARRLRALGWSTALHGVSSAGNNATVTSWPGPYRQLAPGAVVVTDHNQPLVNWHALQGPEAMAAIAATGGRVHGVDDDALVTARAVAMALGVHPTAAGAVALAGLSAVAETLSGTHVALLCAGEIAGAR